VRGVDYYELLGVPRSASPSQIRSAYRSLAKVMHPDAGGTAGTFRLLREAYETLTDPDRRDEYDGGGPEEEPLPPPRRATPRAEDYVPALPALSPEAIAWWHEVRETGRTVLLPQARPGRDFVLAAAGGWLLLLLVQVLVAAPVAVLVGLWLVLAASGAAVVVLARRHLAARRVDREFTAEFGTRVVFGSPGGEPDEIAERLTADLLDHYLARVPGVRIFHGLATEAGSVFADIDHAVLCGRRLVLIESKLWLPGHYDVDETGGLSRNGRRFRGGAARLPDWIDAYRTRFPGLELRGVLLLHPRRAGEITVGDGQADVAPMAPERFVREIGGWLAVEQSTVDRDAFRTLLRLVISPG
jgi:hypothetical protein